MNVYISADIEGITGITHWDEADKPKGDDYKPFQEQMTREVAAACEGALNAGATAILVKDAHDSGRNLLADQLPEEARLIRGWSGHPLCMVQELDQSFDAVVLIGYHAPAGSDANPLAHSMSLKTDWLKINGVHASEFLLHTYAAALAGAPVVFVSGDEGICREVSALNAQIRTLAVKRGIGDSTISMHPQAAIRTIRAEVEQALRGNLAGCHVALPDHFVLEARYMRHQDAYRAAHYPGAIRADAHTVTFETTAYFDILRMLMFVL